MMANKGWKVVKPHVPMIKFRKGGITRDTTAPSAQSGPTMTQQRTRATGPNVVVLPTLDDLQLPSRYRRRPIDEREIAYINRGGPE